MMVVTIVINGEMIDEIQIENKGVVKSAPYFTKYAWRSTKRVASGEVMHHPERGVYRLAQQVLRERESSLR